MRIITDSSQISDEKLISDINWIASNWKDLQVDDLQVKIIDKGKGDPIIYVPIFTSTEFTYTNLIKSFKKTHRTILYKRKESYNSFISLNDRVTELKLLMDNLNIESAHLNAHSDGAMVAIAFAAKYPSHVKSLTLYTVADVYKIPPYPMMKWFLIALYYTPLQYFIPNKILSTLLAYYGSSNSGLSYNQIKMVTNTIPSMTRFFKYSMLPLLLEYDGVKLAQQVKCPVLLIHHTGVDNIIKLKQTRNLSKYFRHLYNYCELDKGGHMVHYCMPNEIEKITQDFFNYLLLKQGSSNINTPDGERIL